LEKLTVTLLYDVIEDQETSAYEDKPVYRAVQEVLEERGHDVRTLAAGPDVRKLVGSLEGDDCDIVFNLCESLNGVEHHAINVVSLLELLGKRFTGTGSLGQMLAHDKALAKKIFSFHGLSYPRFSKMESGKVEWSDELKFPLFVKPADTDSSVGIDDHSLVRNVKQLMERISYIHTEIKAPVLIEEYIEGRELFVSVLGNDSREAMPIIEWDFTKVKRGAKFATYDAKWNVESEGYKAPELFPDDIPEPVYKRIQQAAVDACSALRIQDYGRVDLRIRPKKGSGTSSNTDDWEMFIIEVNPNPYLERTAEVAMAAARKELAYPDLVEKIMELAMHRNRVHEQPKLTPESAESRAST
jgi:D-alanine-D-alanine ligase